MECAGAAIRYFAECSLDPVEAQAREGQLIMAEVKRLGDRVFSCFQEQGLLLEMLCFQLHQQAVQEQTQRVMVNLLARKEGKPCIKSGKKSGANSRNYNRQPGCTTNKSAY